MYVKKGDRVTAFWLRPRDEYDEETGDRRIAHDKVPVSGVVRHVRSEGSDQFVFIDPDPPYEGRYDPLGCRCGHDHVELKIDWVLSVTPPPPKKARPLKRPPPKKPPVKPFLEGDLVQFVLTGYPLEQESAEGPLEPASCKALKGMRGHIIACSKEGAIVNLHVSEDAPSRLYAKVPHGHQDVEILRRLDNVLCLTPKLLCSVYAGASGSWRATGVSHPPELIGYFDGPFELVFLHLKRKHPSFFQGGRCGRLELLC